MNQTDTIDVAALLDDVDAEGMFSASVTIQLFDGTLGDSGVERKDVEANWDDLADHVDLECMVASDIFMTRITQSREMRGREAITGEDIQHCLLHGYFPEILKTHRAVVTRGSETAAFDISGVEHDSQVGMTRLALRRVEK